MKKIKIVITSIILLSLCSCSTTEKSIRLGSSMGSGIGIAAIHAGYSDSGGSPSSSKVQSAAGIGMVLGLIASYFIHKKTKVKKLKSIPQQPTTYFGDLPPNPFLIPQPSN